MNGLDLLRAVRLRGAVSGASGVATATCSASAHDAPSRDRPRVHTVARRCGLDADALRRDTRSGEHYSVRRTLIGSIRAARRAGSQPATNATPASITTAPPTVTGSR